MEKLKKIYLNYRHGIPLLIYAVIYLNWFGYLERTVTKHYHVIHIPLDNHIPFVEVFIIPYMMWFAYVALVVAYLFFKDKESYKRCCLFLFTGMTIFLVISTLWPNGHHLRPYVMPRDNIFTQMIANLYQTDTSTNIWPSIHVYNSIGAHLALSKCPRLKKYKLLQAGSFVLCISIILSTMLIKQHSAFDVITAFILAGVMYVLTYDNQFNLFTLMRKWRNRLHPQTSH